MVASNMAALLLLATCTFAARSNQESTRNHSLRGENNDPYRHTNDVSSQHNDRAAVTRTGKIIREENGENTNNNDKILMPETPDTLPESEADNNLLALGITSDDRVRALESLIFAPDFPESSFLFEMDSEIEKCIQILVESWSEHPDLISDLPQYSNFKPTPKAAIDCYRYGGDSFATITLAIEISGRLPSNEIPAETKVIQARNEKTIVGTVVQNTRVGRTQTNLLIKYDVAAFEENGCNPSDPNSFEYCFSAPGEFTLDHSSFGSLPAVVSTSPPVRAYVGALQYDSVQKQVLELSDFLNKLQLDIEGYNQIPFAQEYESFQHLFDTPDFLDMMVNRIMKQPEMNVIPQPTNENRASQSINDIIQTIPWETMPWDSKIYALSQILSTIGIREKILSNMHSAVRVCNNLPNYFGDARITAFNEMTNYANEAKYSFIGSNYFIDTENIGLSNYKIAHEEAQYWENVIFVSDAYNLVTAAVANVNAIVRMGKFIDALLLEDCALAKEWETAVSDITAIPYFQRTLRNVKKLVSMPHDGNDLEKIEAVVSTIATVGLLQSRGINTESFKHLLTIFDIISVEPAINSPEFKINYRSAKDINIDFQMIATVIEQALPLFNLECYHITGLDSCFLTSFHDKSSSYVFQSDVTNILEVDRDLLKHKQLAYKIVEKLHNGHSIYECEEELGLMEQIAVGGEKYASAELVIETPHAEIPSGTKMHLYKKINGQAFHLDGITTESCDTMCNVLHVSSTEYDMDIESIKCDFEYDNVNFLTDEENVVTFPSIIVQDENGVSGSMKVGVEVSTLDHNLYSSFRRITEMSRKAWKLLTTDENPTYKDATIHQLYSTFFVYDCINCEVMEDYPDVIYNTFKKIALENRQEEGNERHITPDISVIAAHFSLIYTTLVSAAISEFGLAVFAMEQIVQCNILTERDAVHFLDKSFAYLVGSMHDTRSIMKDVSIARTFQSMAERLYKNFPTPSKEQEVSISRIRVTSHESLQEGVTEENSKVESFFLVELKKLYNEAQHIIMNKKIEPNDKINPLKEIFKHVKKNIMAAFHQDLLNVAFWDNENDKSEVDLVELQAEAIGMSYVVSPLYFNCDIEDSAQTNERNIPFEFIELLTFRDYDLFKVEETMETIESVNECREYDLSSLYTVIVNGKPMELTENIASSIATHEQNSIL